MARSMFTTNTILNMRSSSPSSWGSHNTQEETLRLGFGQTPGGLMYHGVPVETKASLWAPHSPACWSSTWPPPRQTRSECAGAPGGQGHGGEKGQRTDGWITVQLQLTSYSLTNGRSKLYIHWIKHQSLITLKYSTLVLLNRWLSLYCYNLNINNRQQ